MYVLVHVLQPGAMVGWMRVWVWVGGSPSVPPSGGRVKLGLGLGLPLLHTRRTGRKACQRRLRCGGAQTDRRRADSQNNGVEMTNQAVAMTMASQLVHPAIDSQSWATLGGR